MSNQTAYVRHDDAPLLPPPPSEQGVMGWMWQNVFSSMSKFGTFGAAIGSILMIILTVVFGFVLVWMTWKFLDFTIFSAVWTDPENLGGAICSVEGVGACWPYIGKWFYGVMVGNEYPREEVWRVYSIYAMLAAGVTWLIIEGLPYKKYAGIFMLTIFPILAFVFLNGSPIDNGESFNIGSTWFPLAIGGILLGLGLFGRHGSMGSVVEAFAPALLVLSFVFIAYGVIPLFAGAIDSAFGFEVVRTARWGGLLVTLVVAITGIIVSLPLGILLALGRQSNAPIIKWCCIVFIEVVRGIPLISVLFFASVMLQYFLPSDFDFNKLLRALIGVALFASAYMAEVIRGGLQAMPKGQYEGGQSVGLSYWQQMRLIILPQALTTVIPGIVNTFIGLFKDTTLVMIISIFDVLGIIQFKAGKDILWYSPVTGPTGYVFAALLFWVFCFGMSRYSLHMERKLHRGHR